jgi:hypothetical protein
MELEHPNSRSMTTARSRPAGPVAALAIQRSAGNRVTRTILRREVLTQSHMPLVRFTIGKEITPELADAAWRATSSRPLDPAGVEALRKLALRDGTVDDNERMFIAALLHPGCARMLHHAHPAAFSRNGLAVEFPAKWIPAASRARVGDFGRTAVSAAGDFAETVRKTLAMADRARIPRAEVQTATLEAASDSTPGDRALAGAVYVLARRAALPVAADLVAGRIKVDEVPQSYIEAIAGRATVRAFYVPRAKGGLKGDTIYIPSTFDVGDLEHQGTVVHELTHAADDKSARGVERPTVDKVELKAYRAQARYYLAQISTMTGTEREKAIGTLASRKLFLVLAMLMEVANAPAGSRDKWLAIAGDLNDIVEGQKIDAALWEHIASRLKAGPESREVEELRATLETMLLPAVLQIVRRRPGETVDIDGLSGESELDWALPEPRASTSQRQAPTRRR